MQSHQQPAEGETLLVYMVYMVGVADYGDWTGSVLMLDSGVRLGRSSPSEIDQAHKIHPIPDGLRFQSYAIESFLVNVFSTTSVSCLIISLSPVYPNTLTT